MNNKGFTLIELLAVIIVLAVIIGIAVSSVLPAMTEARESAFRTEATRVVKRADDAYSNYLLGVLDVKNDTKSCVTLTKACFTVDELIDKGVSEIKKGTYVGKIEMKIEKERPIEFTLYFKKGAEFSFVNQKYGDFSENGVLNDAAWDESYEKCSCE